MASLKPPTSDKAKVGDVWVHPITKRKLIFTGEQWEPWSLQNEREAYEKGEDQ